MQILFEKPPIFERALKLFNLSSDKIVFFAYGDKIYSPSGKMPPDDFLEHESVHCEQQEHSEQAAKIWWERYFTDKDFRIAQEAEAYGAQFKYLKGRYRDRNAQARILHNIAGLLCDPMYATHLSHTEAMQMIKAYADGSAIRDIEEHMPEADAPNL